MTQGNTVIGDMVKGVTMPDTKEWITVTRRQGVVDGTIDWPNRRAGVRLGNSAILIPDVLFIESVHPQVGETCWVDFGGPDPMIVAMQENDAWTFWTPTFAGFPVGTAEAKYHRMGSKCSWTLEYNFDAGGFTTTPMTFTLPFTVAGAVGFAAAGVIRVGTRWFTIGAYVVGSTGVLGLICDFVTSGTTGEVTVTNPATIGANDVLIMSGVYHSA